MSLCPWQAEVCVFILYLPLTLPVSRLLSCCPEVPADWILWIVRVMDVFWRLVALLVFLVSGSICLEAGDAEDEFVKAVMELTGCRDAEDLGEDEMERFAELYSAPLRINYASRSRLLASGLFSVYQVAVLMDYREMAGDVLSLEELASLDGFGHGAAAALRPFISLDSAALPGRSSAPSGIVGNRLTLKSGIRNVSDRAEPQGTYSMKYRVTAGEAFEGGLSLRSAYGEGHFPPEKFSFFSAFYLRRYPGKIVVGDYSLRFGQGLALWSGFSMGGFSSPASFSRRPSGISPYNSYSGEGAFRGVAADFGIRDFNVSAFVSGLGIREMMEGKEDFSRDVMCGANAGWYGMSGQLSVTGYAVLRPAVPEMGADRGGVVEGAGPVSFQSACCSADARFSVRGTDIFSEAAFDFTGRSLAALAGFRTPVSDALKLAAMARYYPASYSSGYAGAARGGSRCSNEYGAAFALSWTAGEWVAVCGRTGFGSSEKRFQGSFSADAMYSPEPRYRVDTSSVQVKLLLSGSLRISPVFSLSFRLSERYRTYGRPFRTDARLDFGASLPSWNCNVRVNVLHCESLSWLSYAEGGYRADRVSVWFRAGAFMVDNWDDRIYAYERDAPGNFNSPAYYGRGYWLALTFSVRLSKSVRLYFRGLFQDYPWLRPGEPVRKPPKVEMKLQLSVDLDFIRGKKRHS